MRLLECFNYLQTFLVYERLLFMEFLKCEAPFCPEKIRSILPVIFVTRLPKLHVKVSKCSWVYRDLLASWMC